MVFCLERGADLHTAQLMPLLLTVSCFSKIKIGFTFLVPVHPGSPGQRVVKCVWGGRKTLLSSVQLISAHVSIIDTARILCDRVCVMILFCPPVCPISNCSRGVRQFAAVGPVGRRYCSTVVSSGKQQQQRHRSICSMALSS